MTVINTTTGELVPLSPTSLQPMNNAMREVAVSTYLEHAKNWLSTAVDLTGPEQIAAAKAEIATAAEATKQLNLSKEIQLDAQEMVRRAEYALGKAIRKGQAEGTVAIRGYQRNGGEAAVTQVPDLVGKNEWRGPRGIAAVVDETPDPADFDAAIDAAKAEGNLSRANVARKAREKSGRSAEPAAAGTTERAHQEAELINAFGSIVRRSLTPKNVATLTPKARARLISILNEALNTLQETSS